MSESPQGKKPVVPKFSSFKPKPAAQSIHKAFAKAGGETVPAPNEGGQRSKESDKSHRSHRHHRHRHHDRRKTQSPDAREHQPIRRERDEPVQDLVADRELVKKVRDERTVTDTASLGKDLFIVDTKGDHLLSKYGPDRWNALQFRRARREAVLGTDGYLVIHRDGPHDTFSIRLPGESSGPSLRDKNPFRHVKYMKSKTIKVKEQSVEPEGHDFISLTTRKRMRGDEEDSSSDDQLPEYRRIEGKKTGDGSNDDNESESEASNPPGKEQTVEAADPLKQRSIRLSRRVKADPTDIPAWLELVDHQDVLMSVGANPAEDIATNEIKSFAEIKISMYEEALTHAKSRADREQLLAGLIREGIKVWTAAELAKRWDAVKEEMSDSFVLWKAHLEYEIANVTTFDFSRTKEVFLDRIALLKKKASDVSSVSVPAQDELESLYRQILYVFLRATRFLYDTGYIELSVAAWQALLELNFMGGEDTVVSGAKIPEVFSDFWEAEVPRIGEACAHGWGRFANHGGDLVSPEPRPADDETSASESRDGYKKWAWQELRRARAARMPARTLDEGTDNDPFKVVMYSDLDGLPFVIPLTILSSLKAHVFDAFLIFCRLPPIHLSGDWEADPFLAPADKGFNTKLSHYTPASAPQDEEPIRPPPMYLTGRVTPAIFPRYICSVIEWGEGYRGHHKPVDFTWVLLVLKQLVQHGQEELGMYYLALEWLRDRDSIKKAAKPLIKKYPLNLAFYNLYGLFEWANRNPEISHNVLKGATQLSEVCESALRAGRMFTNIIQSSASGIQNPLPWFSWAWSEFIEEQPISSVMARLCSAANIHSTSENLSPVQLLTARDAFSSDFEKSLTGGGVDISVLPAKCWAFLEYLWPNSTNTESQSEKQGNISAAMHAVWRCSTKLLARGDGSAVPHEALLDFAATLLYIHAARGPYRRSFLCENLQKAVKLFPRNTFLLSLFSWANSSLRIRSDLHEVLYEYVLVGSNDGVPVRICAITHELLSGTVYSTRAAFEKALNSEAAKSCAPLWAAYIRFCYSRKEIRTKAKEVYYRALARCPWSKEVVMEGFTTLVRDMESAELRAAFSGMGEKGLRVHIDLDEFIARKKLESEGNGRPRKERK